MSINVSTTYYRNATVGLPSVCLSVPSAQVSTVRRRSKSNESIRRLERCQDGDAAFRQNFFDNLLKYMGPFRLVMINGQPAEQPPLSNVNCQVLSTSVCVHSA